MIDLNKARKFTDKLLVKVGRTLINSQKKVKIKNFKDRQDIVTNIDLKAENIIIKAIKEKYPRHNILSEENGLINNNSFYTWVIDPLDGTKEYYRAMPVFNINISLEYKDTTILGSVYSPKTNDLYIATVKDSSFKNSTKISVSREVRLKNSFIYTHLPSYKMNAKRAKWVWTKLAKLSKSCYRLRSFQADIISLCWVAQGSIDGYILFSLMEKWWDIAAGLFIVKKAGGKITDFNGKLLKNKQIKDGFIVSNGKIHNQLIDLINKK